MTNPLSGSPDRRCRLRLFVWLLASSAVVFCCYHPAARAFQEPVIEEETPAEPPAPAANQAGAAPEPAGGDVETYQRRSFLTVLLDGLGWVFSLVFLFISITLVALIVMNVLMARNDALMPATLIEEFDGHVKERRYQDAYNLVKDNESFLARVLTAGMAKLTGGYEQAMEAMQEEGEKQNMTLEHRLSYVSLIGTVSPMIGLFGTVYGMMESFGQIRAAGDVTPKASELAGGIETALTTTLVGLFLAIPAIIAYGLLRNFVTRRVLEVGIISEGLMSRGFANVSRRAGGKENTGAGTA
jgi:biopolymer transport protein ExbB